MFRDRFQISRERLEFFYSIIVLCAIPVLMITNTLLLMGSVQNNFDSELRRKADMANEVVVAASLQSIDDIPRLQTQLTKIAESSDELQKIVITSFDSRGNFKVLAATDTKLIDTQLDNVQFSLAASRKQSIAQLVSAEDGTRAWEVVTPMVVDDTIKGVVLTSVSLERSDALIGNTLVKSLAIVGVTVLVVVLMLVNHFKFVEYAELFRKQKEVDQLKNDFLSVATHELRAPMTVIKGNIENLVDGISGQVDDKGKAALRTMYSETDRLTNLVNDLLNVSRIEQGRINYEVTVIDGREVIEQIVTQYTDKATGKGLALNYAKPEQPVYISVDKGRFIEIMTNLVDNAIKYSRQGTVTVAHKDVPGKTRISVRDTGIGMSSEARKRLFSRFYRVQTDATKDIPGTGLGLWIIKQYVEHMKGTITVDSLEGEGSEFIVEFPLASQSAADSAKPPA